MKIKSNSGNFQPCPEYTGSAVCVDVTPLKTVQTQFGPKEKFRFVFEIGETKEDGTPWCVWSAPFTPSYHENSALRPFLRKWMGRELSPDEVKDFDTENLLGRPAHITVIHEHSEGEIYANIALITAGQVGDAVETVRQIRADEGPSAEGHQRLSPRGASRRRRRRFGRDENPRRQVQGAGSARPLAGTSRRADCELAADGEGERQADGG